MLQEQSQQEGRMESSQAASLPPSPSHSANSVLLNSGEHVSFNHFPPPLSLWTVLELSVKGKESEVRES